MNFIYKLLSMFMGILFIYSVDEIRHNRFRDSRVIKEVKMENEGTFVFENQDKEELLDSKDSFNHKKETESLSSTNKDDSKNKNEKGSSNSANNNINEKKEDDNWANHLFGTTMKTG